MSPASLGKDGARRLVLAALEGSLSEAEITEALVAMAKRGETADEVLGGALALRERMLPFEHDHPHAVDTAGTGGDGLGSFNLSTAAAIVAAAAGATVIKHGNRASSSPTGSADLIEALGIPLDLTPAAARRVLDKVGITFLFAPKYHPAMGAVADLRRRLGQPTLFNLLGPLSNPGRVQRQLVGVASLARVASHAAALDALGVERALVVHGAGGADELTLAGPNHVRTAGTCADLHKLPSTSFDAQELGLEAAPITALRGGDQAANLDTLRRLLDDEAGPIANATCLNAAACLVAAGVAASPADGLLRAQEALRSGAARTKLNDWIDASQPKRGLPGRLATIVHSVERRARTRPQFTLPKPVPERRAAFTSALLAPGLSIIAECKRRSPSRGEFGSALSIEERAALYAEGGAAALSILTERDHFGGDPADLAAAAVAGLPRLRKDFLIDANMVAESVAMGADAVLLIAAILPGSQLAELRLAASELGLAVLVEAHDEEDLERALSVAPDCVGINARNLATFEVDLTSALKLVRRVRELDTPPIIVAESGILTREDASAAADAGADAILVGEALMRADDPRHMLRKLQGAHHVR